ncbi:MAG: nuclear transport factor 2 family protein [Pseudorhodoplanes sp.]
MSQSTLAEREDKATKEVVTAFLNAFNRHDVEGIVALMSEDCVYESTVPAPNGTRVVGHPALREAWKSLFAARPDAIFKDEETFIMGDRAVARWNLCWTDNGKEQNIRGIDILKVRDGKVVEKLAYTKR